ncbi:hypothetical protein [Mesorhizobium sp. WSM3859]|uniref:hypothetical protein n=1 Tax=Mesorhizobium sp. WSM3859 TaxID=2029402 RepID=UPI001596CA5A|nr:hypothetical protein [Mesorhizobium sp. WSM3859]
MRRLLHFHVFFRRRFETGLALLSRRRASITPTPDFRTYSLRHAVPMKGISDIAGLTDFPTGRAYRHVFDLVCPLDDRACNRASTSH